MYDIQYDVPAGTSSIENDVESNTGILDKCLSFFSFTSYSANARKIVLQYCITS